MNKEKYLRYFYFIIGIIIVSISYNSFVLPSNIVYGVGGIGVILKKIYNIDNFLTIFISSFLLLLLSFMIFY